MEAILEGLNKEQTQAVSTTDGPILIIAGAGTGKTTVITRRIANIIEKKLAKPSEILALTFTEKAASEMEERVDVLVPYGYIDTWISTFNAFGNRVLQEKAIDIGLPSDFQVLTRTQQVVFFQQNLFAFNLNYYRPLANPTKFIEAILSFISRCKDEDIRSEDYKNYVAKLKKTPSSKIEGSKEEWRAEVARQEELAGVYEKYEELKTQAGKLDYGDQVSQTLKLFRSRPKILKEYQEKFKYILVDEYQDTNYAQNELVKLLASKGKNICVVGDDDQCLVPGTLVATTHGNRKIELLKEGDAVLTAVGKGSLGISKITKVFKNNKTARFLTITTKSGKKVTVTDNHKVFCYIPSTVEKGKNHYVYLMFRQNLGWRIGVTNNLVARLKLERTADKIIGVKAFKTDQEARYFEMLWSLTYGIPPTVFQERKNVIAGELLLRLYAELDSQKGVERLAEALHIDLDSPHSTLDAVTRGVSRRIKINLEICSRNYRSKNTGILKSPLLSHLLYLETSDPATIQALNEAGFKLNKAKKGLRLRIQSNNLLSLGKTAEKLARLTGGFIEPKFSIGIMDVQSKPALVMPAGNLLVGHYLPIIKSGRVFYDEIVVIKEMVKQQNVYDLEIDQTHNFVANGILVHNSIYKFRGAAISNILKFKDDYRESKQIILTTNYRSTQNLLDSSYRLIRYNDSDRLEVQNKIDKKLIAATGETGEPPQEIACPTLSDEADFVAKEIKKLIKNKVNYKDIAILVRANAQADSFLRALNLLSIPYKFSGSSGLYSQPEVSLLISFLNAISKFDDSLSLYDLATSDLYQLPLRDCIAAMDYSKRGSKTLSYTFRNAGKIEGLELSQEGAAIIQKINSDIDTSLELSRHSNVGQVLYTFLEKSRYLTRLESEASVEAEVKIQNIAKFFDKIKEFINLSSNETTRAFVDYLETIRTAGDDPSVSDYDPDIEAVNVMTVHAAKGLEFEVVFMVGLVSDRFPSRERAEIIKLPEDLIKEILPVGDFHVQEERRLFYVGSTRARSKLYYTWSKDQGGKRVKKISPFILEALGKVSEVKAFERKAALEKISQFAVVPREKRSRLPEASRKIIELSQGSIDDYETCAYKYRYSHVLHLPILRHHAVVYGFALHAAVAQFYRARLTGRILKLDELYQELEKTWVSEGFLSAEHEEKRLIQAKDVLKSFWQREKTNSQLPTFVEKPFKFSLRSGEVSVIVNGRYDRVDEEADLVRIIDYKSTENRTKADLEKNAKESIQLKVYTLAYFRNSQVVPDFVGIYDLASGLIGGYQPKEEDLKKTEEEIIEVARKIRGNLQDDSFPANPKYFGRTPACNYCAYNSICPFSLTKK